MAPFFPKLFKHICAMGCPNGLVTSAITSEPMVKAMEMTTPMPTNNATTSDDTIAKGTAFAAFEASSAIVADDSNPETTHTGVKRAIMKAHPLFNQKTSVLFDLSHID